uniref:Ig-like domain-containing protein n=1 Tax=Sander lucioperca TaxID=283035 RepID=A0A8C9ZLX4_SANLU
MCVFSAVSLHSIRYCKGEDRVIQPTGDVITNEGETVSLDCTFETTDPSPTLFWYKQGENDYPKMLLQPQERIDATIKNKSFPLKIQKLQLSDSAVYYCALRPTVTGNTKTLESHTDKGPHYQVGGAILLHCVQPFSQ